jgi:hypothetical protein
MFDQLLSSRRNVIAAIVTAGALFLVVAALLAVRMGLGDDPSLGRDNGRVPATRVEAPQTADRGWSDDGGQTYDDGQGYQQPQERQGEAPLQSGTS